MTNLQVLLLIAAFLVLTVGSFVWYVATWDSKTAAIVKINGHLPDRMHGMCMGCASHVPFGKRG